MWCIFCLELFYSWIDSTLSLVYRLRPGPIDVLCNLACYRQCATYSLSIDCFLSLVVRDAALLFHIGRQFHCQESNKFCPIHESKRQTSRYGFNTKTRFSVDRSEKKNEPNQRLKSTLQSIVHLSLWAKSARWENVHKICSSSISISYNRWNNCR